MDGSVLGKFCADMCMTHGLHIAKAALMIPL